MLVSDMSYFIYTFFFFLRLDSLVLFVLVRRKLSPYSGPSFGGAGALTWPRPSRRRHPPGGESPLIPTGSSGDHEARASCRRLLCLLWRDGTKFNSWYILFLQTDDVEIDPYQQLGSDSFRQLVWRFWWCGSFRLAGDSQPERSGSSNSVSGQSHGQIEKKPVEIA